MMAFPAGGVLNTAAKRIAGNSALGAAMNPENRTAGAVTGGIAGVAGEGIAKLIGAVRGGAGRLKDAVKYGKDPVAAQDAAIGAIDKAHSGLKESYQSQIEPKLAQMKYKIDPRRFQGTVPEADDVISAARSERTYGDLPEEMEITGVQGEKIRRALEAEVKYPQGTSVALPKEVADKYVANKALADGLRSQRRLGQDEDLAGMYDEWSTKLGQADDLAKRSGRPAAFTASQSTDDLALKARIDAATGSNLNSLGERISEGNHLRNASGIGDYSWNAAKSTSKGAMEGARSGDGGSLAAFITSLMSGKHK
jgi:hypothetical protein